MIRTRTARCLRLGLGADRADHRRANVLEPLHQQQPDPASRRVDQHRPAGLHLGAALHQKLRGRRLEHGRRRCAIIDAIRHGKQAGGGNIAGAGIGTTFRPKSGDAVARLEPGDPCAHRGDCACRLQTQTARQLHRVDTPAVIGIDEIDPHRRLHQRHLTRTRRRQLILTPADNLWPASAGDFCPDSSHF